MPSNIQSQRELADRMTAGGRRSSTPTARLSFFNQPFATMAQIDPDWLAEKPEFDRLLERMRENGRLPEVRDFPAWKEERRDWFTSARGSDSPRIGSWPTATIGGSSPSRCPMAACG